MKNQDYLILLSLFILTLISVTGKCSMDFSEFTTRGFEGKGPLEFNSPEDVVITRDGQIVVADQNNNRIQVFDAKGDFARFLPAKVTEATIRFSPPANESNSERKARESEENRLNKLQNSFREPLGIALDNIGNLYVSMMKDDIILIIDFKSGNVVGSIGKSGKQPGELYYPMDIDISSAGHIAVSEFRNKRVQILDVNGNCLKELRYQEQDAKNNISSIAPRGVHWTNDNRLIVTYPTYNQVVCWEPYEGAVIWRYGGIKGSNDGEMNNPSFICNGVDGSILVSDTLNHRITEISRTGKFNAHYGKRGSAPGRIYVPRGIALTTDENLVIADQGNNRLHFFRPGQATLTLREAKQFALKDDWTNAITRISKVLYLQPNNEQARDLMVNALYYFGNEAFDKGDYIKAEENYRRVLKYRPEDSSIKEKLDAVFWASNQETIAIAVLVVVGIIVGLFCLWIGKVLVLRLLNKKD